jgi:hypothetical protein
MVKNTVKVVIRTRPTNNFCSKNISIDPIHSVSPKLITLAVYNSIQFLENQGIINHLPYLFFVIEL